MYKRGKGKRATRATPAQTVQYHRVTAALAFSLGRAATLEWRPLPAEAPQTTKKKNRFKFQSSSSGDSAAAVLSFQSAETISGVVIKRAFQMFKGSNQRREAF